MNSRRTPLARWLHSLGLARPSEMLVVEQYRMIARQIPVLYSVIIVNCAFMAWLASSEVSPLLAFGFPAIAGPAMLLRIFVSRAQTRRLLGTEDYAGMRKALRITTIMANIMGLVLALWSVLILVEIDSSRAAFVPVFTILSMITCSYCLAVYPIAAYSVMLSGSTYIAVAMVWTGDPVLTAMAGNIGLVSLLVIYMAHQQYGQLCRLVRSGEKLRRQSGQARVLAYQDQLTGLPNRRALIGHMRRHRPADEADLAAMIMIDLNDFKPVNDTFGHAAGDQLLGTISRRLLEVVGGRGLVARLGGDEFCVFLADTAEPGVAIGLAEQIRLAILDPLMLDGHLLHLGVALGVAVGPVSPDDPFALLQSADIALYEAKSAGGNAIRLFEAEMEARVKRRTLIEHALANPQQITAIRLEYQPIFALRSDRLMGYEALARWDHPELGNITPAEFIEVAERSGKARQLTLHLFREAIAEAATWHEELSLSFNLSGSGLVAAGFEHSFPTILAELGFAPERLILEVTETALLVDPVAAWGVLGRLQQRGIRIVLDDFGAGHASIGYLRDLQLDGIKLDGSLIREITTDPRSRKLLFGVLQLCRSIGVAVTAEQVESAEQLRALQAFPIDHVQGFFLGRPGQVPTDRHQVAKPMARAG